MKKDSAVTKMFGLSQHDMAMLLGVSRSQLAMYELGQRSLPTAAMLKLASLMQQQGRQKQANKNPDLKKQQAKIKTLLEKMLRENEYQLLRMERKIAGVSKKIETAGKLTQLAGYLESGEDKKEIDKVTHDFIKRKALKTVDSDDAVLLLQLEIKKELLVFEKSLLEARLKPEGKTG